MSATFPAIGHVALTVRDLEVSVPWYAELFDGEPVLDEDTGPFRHVVWLVGGTLFGLHQFPDAETTAVSSTSVASSWTTSRSECRIAQSYRCGKSAWISWQ